MLDKAELLLPAGSLVKLKTAVLYGADAVYAGTPDMCLRAQSKFSLEELKEGIEFVHTHHKKIYLTLNLFMHNRDIEKLPVFLETLKTLKPDGVLIADPGVFQYVRQNAPELNLFVSTQANICSWAAVKFWQSQGAKLCVLGREVTFEELKEIDILGGENNIFDNFGADEKSGIDTSMFDPDDDDESIFSALTEGTPDLSDLFGTGSDEE